MAEEIKNALIIHIDEDDEGLTQLKNLIQKNGMVPRDYSINADNPNDADSEENTKSQILAPDIQQFSTLVICVSPETKDAQFVNWIIEYAEEHKKRIVGVWAQGEDGCEVPEALSKYADAVVGWTGNRIVDALNGKINDWENPDGTKCDPRDIKRYDCSKS
ncbi:MAG: hypothetical protein F4X93_00735 [Proteobacteria bacterium]|nr:hypothetical protein [Pseudomonadota bacterium]